ncbi:MAG: hypothetical protein H7Y18_20355 [Clostridiaceae bacterium]|nr:hypothetical protein [Clostridiaceae bacterium]
MLIIIGTFQHSNELELLLASLENNHIARKYIMVVPMDVDPKNPFQFQSRKRDLYYKAMEVGIACATGLSVVGASMGFILKWGPVFWGLIASIIGFLIGFGIYLFLKKFSIYRHLPSKLPEVTVVVQCQDEQSGLIIDGMWKYCALTVGKTVSRSTDSRNTHNDKKINFEYERVY